MTAAELARGIFETQERNRAKPRKWPSLSSAEQGRWLRVAVMVQAQTRASARSPVEEFTSIELAAELRRRGFCVSVATAGDAP